MEKEAYISLPELAKILGISRIAVYKKVKNGEIKAVKIGRNFAVPKKYILAILGKALDAKDKKEIDAAVKKTVKAIEKFLQKHMVNLDKS